MFFLSRINAIWHGRFGAPPVTTPPYVIQLVTLLSWDHPEG